jgi:multiple sugar transport system ATP-binding protein
LDGGLLRTAIGDLRVTDELRRRLEAGNGGGRRGVVVGIRPEHFEDASLVTLPAAGHVFKTKVDVLEKLGSDNYAHFTVESEPVSSGELAELAEDSDPGGVAPSAEGVQVIARLAAASAVREGQEAELWVDTSQLQLFDHETGQSLLADDGSRRAPGAVTTSRPPAVEVQRNVA